MPKSYIYLFRRTDGWYKIGYTSALEQRFRSWSWESRSNQYGMFLVGLVEVENPRSAERQFQAIFRNKRTEKRHNGFGPRRELFKLDRADLSRFWFWATIIGTKIIKAELDIECPDWLPALRKILNG